MPSRARRIAIRTCRAKINTQRMTRNDMSNEMASEISAEIPAFPVFRLHRGTAPLLVSLPHDGSAIPASLAASVKAAVQAFLEQR